ncbi:DUF2165 family protein [Marinobacterium rhizophilum]|uniref:DUF2165 family protein n=1 Tax=Marinobacterium rhizophilum TaxID=420402 RepID=UPI000361CA4A|nr:DUF2165 family protein [Marinobacterium rhizophilum]
MLGIPQTVILAGLGFWLLIAAINNRVDATTNIVNIRAMITLELLREEEIRGQGLLGRAIPGHWAPTLLRGIVAIQLLTSVSLLIAAAWRLWALVDPAATPMASLTANAALTLFSGLWLGFLCGGLWFGYWIKQGAIQLVHLLLALTILALLLVNLPMQH